MTSDVGNSIISKRACHTDFIMIWMLLSQTISFSHDAGPFKNGERLLCAIAKAKMRGLSSALVYLRGPDIRLQYRVLWKDDSPSRRCRTWSYLPFTWSLFVISSITWRSWRILTIWHQCVIGLEWLYEIIETGGLFALTLCKLKSLCIHSLSVKKETELADIDISFKMIQITQGLKKLNLLKEIFWGPLPFIPVREDIRFKIRKFTEAIRPGKHIYTISRCWSR